MDFLQFQRQFAAFPAISIQEIRKLEPRFNPRNLGNWQAKGYLKKIRNGWYVFADRELSEPLRFAIANLIYVPSYVSLQSALSWHGFIPEGVFLTTSVSSRKTQNFAGEAGRFSFQNIRPAHLTGYKLLEVGGWRFKMADREKTLADFLHLHPNYDNPASIAGLRLNPFILKELDWAKLENYALLFDNKLLIKRLQIVQRYAFTD